jgi:hypothetical protein
MWHAGLQIQKAAVLCKKVLKVLNSSPEVQPICIEGKTYRVAAWRHDEKGSDFSLKPAGEDTKRWHDGQPTSFQSKQSSEARGIKGQLCIGRSPDGVYSSPISTWFRTQDRTHESRQNGALTSRSEQEHKNLRSGMAIQSVAVQLAHIGHQLGVVVEDVAKERVDAWGWVLKPLHERRNLGASKRMNRHVPNRCSSSLDTTTCKTLGS